jgi:hypothetical protein
MYIFVSFHFTISIPAITPEAANLINIPEVLQ